ALTTGTAVGLWANRPATCTPGVGYWATDQGGNWDTTNGTVNDGALYVCGAANTFQPYYTPYRYPHPLDVVTGPVMAFTQQHTTTWPAQASSPAITAQIYPAAANSLTLSVMGSCTLAPAMPTVTATAAGTATFTGVAAGTVGTDCRLRLHNNTDA